MQNSEMEPTSKSPKCANYALKVGTKRLRRNDDLILLLKAMKIALDASVFECVKVYDTIFGLLPMVIDQPAPVILDVGANMGSLPREHPADFPLGRSIVSSRCTSMRWD